MDSISQACLHFLHPSEHSRRVKRLHTLSKTFSILLISSLVCERTREYLPPKSPEIRYTLQGFVTPLDIVGIQAFRGKWVTA